MVWIKDKDNQYVNLEQIHLLYIFGKNDCFNIYALYQEGERRPIICGFKSIEEAQTALDDLMKKVK